MRSAKDWQKQLAEELRRSDFVPAFPLAVLEHEVGLPLTRRRRELERPKESELRVARMEAEAAQKKVHESRAAVDAAEARVEALRQVAAEAGAAAEKTREAQRQAALAVATARTNADTFTKQVTASR